MTNAIETGQIAPEFSLKGDDGRVHTLEETGDTWTLLYFYPKDDTPGCTTEACAIRDVYDEFVELGVTVFGVSKDTITSHQAFKEKYNLPFTLLSDPDGEVAALYGAAQKKSWFRKGSVGFSRISFLIDPAGTIARVYPKVDPAAHAFEILSDVRECMSA